MSEITFEMTLRSGRLATAEPHTFVFSGALEVDDADAQLRAHRLEGAGWLYAVAEAEGVRVSGPARLATRPVFAEVLGLRPEAREELARLGLGGLPTIAAFPEELQVESLIPRHVEMTVEIDMATVAPQAIIARWGGRPFTVTLATDTDEETR